MQNRLKLLKMTDTYYCNISEMRTVMYGSQVCRWLAAEASPSLPIRSVCSPHTLAVGISSAGLLCAVGGKVKIIRSKLLFTTITVV